MLDVFVESKQFRTVNRSHLKALHHVRFQVPEGEFACLVGPSGCGKTTTLRLILGLDGDYSGRITAPPGRVAAVFQEPRLLPWRSVEENIRLALPPDLAEAELTELFSMLGLAGTEKLFPGEMSLGMARRVALARAFATEPALLTLDEPFVSLDDATAARMRRLLTTVWSSRRTTALMVTHNLSEAAELADRVIVMSKRPGTVRGVYPIEVGRDERDEATVKVIVADLLERWPAEE